ncbi:hypothetical protein GCM10009117_14910 [Gangjinia marincola]|uniref:PKD domain-containing protein n=1 Tax=Gangjinia marincola TaxID=578463 RepID=A0ABN1MGN5_9FLAO
MKTLKYCLILCISIFIYSCDDEERDIDYLNGLQQPSDLTATYIITQDNTGKVTITPSAQSATMFEVFFGDEENSSQEVLAGESAVNFYEEGIYTVRIIATNINGETNETQQELTVTFVAPENVVVDITPDDSNNFAVNVSASADFETFFYFFPGIDDDEDPIPFMEDEILNYVYQDIGEYQATVIALSGGEATTAVTQSVVIENPLLLPITFEDNTLPYDFETFGGAVNAVIDNPDASGINTSSRVAESLKEVGAETFAGSILTVDTPIDFSTLKNISVKTWSPASGITVLLKLENVENADIFIETSAITTTQNSWEELFFDFSDLVDLNEEYQKVILFFDFGNVGDGSIYYFDDVQLSQGEGPPAPAPDPVQSENLVLSLFSDNYDDVVVDTWNTDWSDADYEEIEINGNPTKKYSNLFFNGIETVTSPLDLVAEGVEFLHMDIWTPNITEFKVKLVDFAGDGFGGGNDTEFELSFFPNSKEWVSLDIPLTDFQGMNLNDINQLIISDLGDNDGTVYIDNIYFYSDPDSPDTAAPDPVLPQANVISMFSDVYDDVVVDTWNTDWSAAILEDIFIDGNAAKKYTDLNFNGTETITSPIDLTGNGMTMLHIDLWTPNITAFRVKLVDFGGSGFGGNDDTEFELSFMPNQGEWVSLEIPLTDFEGMNQNDINQFIISADPAGESTIYIDNVYFHN